jgi:hypothetical protein
MAQTVVVAAGTTEANSSTITIAAGTVYTFCLYAASGGVTAGMSALICYDTPGGDVPVGLGELTLWTPVLQVQGPAQVIIKKAGSPTSCGVLQDA